MSVATTDYGAMLDTLDAAIEEAQKKVESGRVYDAESEKDRIKWIRALAYTVKSVDRWRTTATWRNSPRRSNSSSNNEPTVLVDSWPAREVTEMSRKSRRELERELDDLVESSDDDAGDGRALVGPDGILAPPERFGYGRADDGGGDAGV